ncbi:hypothetical protein J3F84DRAFT_356056, partial [Trichoderma pleuroticola]
MRALPAGAVVLHMDNASPIPGRRHEEDISHWQSSIATSFCQRHRLHCFPEPCNKHQQWRAASCLYWVGDFVGAPASASNSAPSTVSSVDVCSGAAPTESISVLFKARARCHVQYSVDGAALHDDTLGVGEAVNPTMLSLMFSAIRVVGFGIASVSGGPRCSVSRSSGLMPNVVDPTSLTRSLGLVAWRWMCPRSFKRTAVSALPPSELFVPGTGHAS